MTRMNSESLNMEPIGSIRTCFQDKFGVPRQPGLVDSARGVIKLRDDPFLKNAVRELDQFSHLWLIFIFHETGSRDWKPSIRPPRLGGAKKVGVLASRSPHRPNPIGLSAVRLVKVDANAQGGVEIEVAGVDILDGTPILDIKPYIPYADSIPDARAGWATDPIERIPVRFDSETRKKMLALAATRYPDIEKLVTEVLSLDPRPAFQKERFLVSDRTHNGLRFGFRVFEFNVLWEIRDGEFLVNEFEHFEDFRLRADTK